MWSLLLSGFAAGALVRKQAVESKSNGEMRAGAETSAETAAEWIFGGSTRHSVCGQRRNRKKPYTMDFEEFSERFAHKVETLKSEIRELRATSTGDALLEQVKKVDDRMDAFAKCADIPDSAIPRTHSIRYQIMDDPKTGWKAMVRWASAHIFAAIYKSEGYLGDKSECHLDGGKLEFVIRSGEQRRAEMIAPGKDYDTYDDAISYIFMPQGCMEPENALPLLKRGVRSKHQEYLRAQTVVDAFEAVADVYGDGDFFATATWMIDGEDGAQDWDDVDERPDSPGTPQDDDGGEDGDYPAEGGVQPFSSLQPLD